MEIINRLLEDDVPEEVVNLTDEIDRTCRDNRSDYVIAALWVMLIKAFMCCEECSFSEAVKHAQELAKSTTLGTRDEALSPLH